MKASWSHKIIKRSNPFYQTCIDRFGAQYKNIASIHRIFINAENKVFAAEWVDKDGVQNFIGGIYPDIVKTIEFKD